MKRFKKVLALVLAGVLALAMLTACGETADPDSIMPEDGTPEVVMTVNNMAANKGLYVIGDGSGVTHSLSHASASGVYVARHIISEEE